MIRRNRSAPCAAASIAAFHAVWTAIAIAVPPSFTEYAPRVPSNHQSAMGTFSSLNVTLLSHLTAEQMDPLIICSGEFCANSCFGHVSPSGREYAVIGLASSTAFVEVTNPLAPIPVAAIPDNESLWSDVRVYGGHAYNINETGTNGDGIQVIDLSDIDNGNVVLVQEYHGPENILRAHSLALNPTSGFLYVAGARTTGGASLHGGGLIAYDLSNPAAPAFAGAWAARYVHEPHVTTYASGPYAGREIAFDFCGSQGLEIVDVTNKGAMFSLSLTTYPGLGYCHQGWTSADKQILYVNDEFDEGNGTTPVTRTLVFDVSNLSAPRLVNTVTTGLAATDHNLYTNDGLLFESNYKSGMHVFDATDPIAPVRIAYIDTYPENDTSGYLGAWNNYPYFPSGNIIISDIGRGLFVVRLDVLRFRYPGGVPRTIPPETPTSFAVHIDDYGSPVVPATATLHYSVDGGPTMQSPLTHLGGGDFTAQLPALPCGSEIEFHLSAENSISTEYLDPAAAPAELFRAVVASAMTTALADDFETNNGWTVGAGVCGGTETGGWVRVDPNGTTHAPENDHDNPGTMCFVTAQGAPGGAIGAADVDGGPFRLTSPVINTNGQDAIVHYARWVSSDDIAGVEQDFFTVEVSVNGGSSWTPVETVPNSGAQWLEHEFLLSDVTTPAATLLVQFSASDCPSDSVTEAGIDDFSVQLLECFDPRGIPTVSQWGTVILTTLLATAGTMVFATRSRAWASG